MKKEMIGREEAYSKLINQTVNLFFDDGTEVRKKTGIIVGQDTANYFLSKNGLVEALPISRVIRIEIVSTEASQ